MVRVCLISAGFFIGSSLMAQDLNVARKNKTYWQQVQADSLHLMIELKAQIPGIVYDLRYATKNNFTKEKLYKRGDMTFLRVLPAQALQKIQLELNSKGLGLKIFDAYRPYSVTKKMWDLIKDERYVANPSKGSGHNRGLAVDLTIITLNTGQELDMGTGFDHFSDTAHQDFTSLPDLVLQNRKMLKEIMEKFGFKALTTEWWHYSWTNDRNYTVLDIDIKKLKK
ncbi:MAG: M15 family metallopeptidase [Flavisolibacter sp.]